jgi:hypothetical protein
VSALNWVLRLKMGSGGFRGASESNSAKDEFNYLRENVTVFNGGNHWAVGHLFGRG